MRYSGPADRYSRRLYNPYSQVMFLVPLVVSINLRVGSYFFDRELPGTGYLMA